MKRSPNVDKQKDTLLDEIGQWSLETEWEELLRRGIWYRHTYLECISIRPDDF